jgi:hypothetical protein
LQGGEVRRHDLQDVDALAREILRQQPLALRALLRDDVQAAAARERGEQHRIAEVGRDRGHHRVVHARFQPQALGDAEHVVDDVPMLDAHALRPAGGAARVDDVGRVLRRHRRCQLGRRAGPVEAIKENRLYARQPRAQARLAEHHLQPGVLEHEREPLLRVRGVERHVGRAGLEHPEDPHHHFPGALDQQTDPRFRPGAEAREVAGEPLGAPLELGVGEPRALEGERRGLGGALRLRLDQVVQAGVVVVHSDQAISSFMISFEPA